MRKGQSNLRRSILSVALALGWGLACAGAGRAAVTTTGSTYYPGGGNDFEVGYTDDGTLTIDGGWGISDGYANLGYGYGASGTATVTGLNSTWTNSGNLSVALYGPGILNILAGGRVNNERGYIGSQAYLGAATVAGSNSIWNNTSTLYVGFGGPGTLSVQGGAQVQSVGGEIGYVQSCPGVATVSGSGSAWTDTGSLIVGDTGSGTLTIEGGGQVSSTSGIIGYANYAPQLATVTVSGAGSMWSMTGSLQVGDLKAGSMVVQGGAHVSNTTGATGALMNSGGTVTVTGAGSTWANGGTLKIGTSGTGTLTVADQGVVSATELSLCNGSGTGVGTLNLRISGNGMVVLGNATTVGSVGNYSNGVGTINFYATPFLAPGTYTPITEYAARTMTWSGTGSYNAYGSSWDNTAHTLTVTAPTALAAGGSGPVTNNELLLVTDLGSGEQVGASFGVVAGGTMFSASPMSGGELAGLTSTPGFTGTVLEGWDFTTNFGGGNVMLSFNVGAGAPGLAVWHLSGSTWAPYTPDVLTYDGNGIASFMVSSFSGYAVAAVPEPATLGLLAAGGLALLRRRRRA